jgi:hypothetical protein
MGRKVTRPLLRKAMRDEWHTKRPFRAVQGALLMRQMGFEPSAATASGVGSATVFVRLDVGGGRPGG